MDGQSPVFAAPAPPAQRQPQIFEFTKRKKWADILVSELPDTAILVLDEEGKIQYVGANTTDLLGWSADELAETSVLDIINDDDRKTFNNRFHSSLSSQQDLSCYTRMKYKPDRLAVEQAGCHNELLFEIRGHTLYLPNDSKFKCFFFMAKPYPSRNMAILNTFLELKIENERLTQRLKNLKTQQNITPINTSDLSLSSSGRSQFSSYEFSNSRDGALVSPSNTKGGGFSTMHSGFVHSTIPGVNSRNEDDDEGGGARKKLKKASQPAQQYVCMTCGRTDSPEWRKGPKGPKTLCNACGLRWAKRSKRSDDVPIPYVHGRDGQDGGRPSPPTPNLGSSRGGRGAPVANAALSVTPTENPPVVSSAQQNSQQGRYDVHAPSPSPTHTSYPHTAMGPPPPPSVGGHYGVHSHVPPPMHHQGMQPSPTAPHGYVPSQAQQHYDTSYDHYTWPVNQRQVGGYGY